MTNNKGNGKGEATQEQIKEFMEAPDELEEGVARITKQAPMIKMGFQFYEKTIEEQSKYWHKLASSLNQACQKIQKERDALNALLFEKEKLLTQAQKERGQDRGMIQKQLMSANVKYQKLLEENQTLQKRITELEK